MALERSGRCLPQVAARDWDGLFKHPALGRNERHKMACHRPLGLLRQRLPTAADVLQPDR